MLDFPKRLTLRSRWMIWRARCSAPVLLSRYDEETAVARLAAVNGGLAILGIGLFAWLTGLPLIFPALGPTAFILFSDPLSPSAAPRSIILGHLIGIGCGYLSWLSVSTLSGDALSVSQGGGAMLCSATVALVGCCVLLVRCRCMHPPACASGLVVALGGVTALPELLWMAGAVGWITLQGSLMNRWSGLPTPTWRPIDRDPTHAS